MKKNNWTSPNFGKMVSPELVPEEALEGEFVILLLGNNLFGDPIYSYLQLTGKAMREMFAKMQASQNFKPSDFGTVLAAGRGEPPKEVRDEMATTYNMIDVPMPKLPPKPAFVQPKFFGDE